MYRNNERNIYNLLLTILFTVWFAPCIAFPANLHRGTLQSDSIPNIFLKIVPSKAKVYVGEPFTLQYLFYYSIPIIDPQNELSIKFKDCDVEEYPADTSSTTKKIIGGKVFHIVILKKLLLIASSPARLRIPPISINLQSNAPALASDFFGTEQTVKQKISSAPQIVEVLALPNSIGDVPFSGGVGSFKIAVSYTRAVSVNTLIVTVDINGTGNLKFSKVAIPKLPEGLEAFNAINNQSYTLNSDGITSHQVFRFNLVSNYKGNFVIPPFSYSYFDPHQGKYIITSAAGYSFETTTGQRLVSAQATSAAAKAGAKNNEGKLYFYGGGAGQSTSNQWLAGIQMSLSLIGVSALLFLIGFGYRYTGAKNKQNIIQINYNRAFKIATRAIKNLNRQSLNLDNELFYKNLCAILKTYICAKSRTDLLRFADINPSAMLMKHRIPPEVYSRTLIFLNSEYGRFAPYKKELSSKDVGCATLLQIINALDGYLND